MNEIPALDLAQLLRLLVDEGVEFIIIGGVAAILHGSARLTLDVDIVYRRTTENIVRLAESLQKYHPYLRGAPPNLPFRWDAATITAGLNFTLITDLGNLDVLGEIVGGGSYDQLLPYSHPINAFGIQCLCLDLDKLIYVKRAAGRPKDLEAIAELELLLARRKS